MTTEYKSEREFTKFLREFLLNKKLVFCGLKHGTGWETKKLTAQITHVDITKTKVKDGGRCDVMIYHDGLDLDYDHLLGNPLKLELKTDKTWKDSLSQAMRYKLNSEKKYGQTTRNKIIEVAVCTPSLFHTGAFEPDCCPSENCQHTSPPSGHKFSSYNKSDSCQQFVIKRVFWKSGVGLLEKSRRDNCVQITVNEGDKMRII